MFSVRPGFLPSELDWKVLSWGTKRCLVEARIPSRAWRGVFKCETFPSQVTTAWLQTEALVPFPDLLVLSGMSRAMEV